MCADILNSMASGSTDVDMAGNAHVQISENAQIRSPHLGPIATVGTLPGTKTPEMIMYDDNPIPHSLSPVKKTEEVLVSRKLVRSMSAQQRIGRSVDRSLATIQKKRSILHIASPDMARMKEEMGAETNKLRAELVVAESEVHSLESIALDAEGHANHYAGQAFSHYGNAEHHAHQTQELGEAALHRIQSADAVSYNLHEELMLAKQPMNGS